MVVLQGKFYLIIEELSQLFRSLVPIQLWYKYIMGDDPSSSYFLGGILIILYSLCKASTTSLITSVGAVAKAEKRSTVEGNKYTSIVAITTQEGKLQQLGTPCALVARGILLHQDVGIGELEEDL